MCYLGVFLCDQNLNIPTHAVIKPAVKRKAPANSHKLPDPIREGEIVKDISKREWRLGKSIGVGGFGEIYAGEMSKLNF